MARLVAVLGYSTRRGGALHPVCAARLRAAEEVAADADAVVLSGWARRRHHPSEAELMTAAWHGPDVPLVPDGDARTTAGNARGVAARAGGGDEGRRGHLGLAPAARAGTPPRRARATSSSSWSLPRGRDGSACAPASSPACSLFSAPPLRACRRLRRRCATTAGRADDLGRGARRPAIDAAPPVTPNVPALKPEPEPEVPARSASAGTPSRRSSSEGSRRRSRCCSS